MLALHLPCVVAVADVEHAQVRFVVDQTATEYAQKRSKQTACSGHGKKLVPIEKGSLVFCRNTFLIAVVKRPSTKHIAVFIQENKVVNPNVQTRFLKF